MSLVRDFDDFNNTLKKLVVGTSETTKPTSIMYGKVISTNPLKINVEQRMIFDKKFLVLTERLVKDSPLKVNDKVVLLREQGGQKFLVIDKVVSA